MNSELTADLLVVEDEVHLPAQRPISRLERLLLRLAGDRPQAPEPRFPIDLVCDADVRIDPPHSRDDNS